MKKKIILNPELSIEQKKIIGGRINAIIRQNESIDKISDAKKILEENGKRITQNEVANITKLNLKTVKRNWNLQKRDIESVMEAPTQVILYRGYKKVEIEKVTTEDKKLFIEKANEIKKMYGEVLENHIIELNLFNDNHKSWYIYDKWRKKYGYKDNGKMEQEIQ